MKKKIELTYNGQNVHAIIVSYVQNHENITFPTIEEIQAYKKSTGKCSQRSHIDSHTMILDRDELSSKKNQDIKNTLWLRVRKVNVTMNEFLFTLVAINNHDKTTMQEIIPVSGIDKVNIHHFDPNIKKHKLPSGKQIHCFNNETIEALK